MMLQVLFGFLQIGMAEGMNVKSPSLILQHNFYILITVYKKYMHHLTCFLKLLIKKRLENLGTDQFYKFF